MNMLNYIIEANVGLILFLLAYVVVLRKETNFKINRLFLLAGVIVSLLFPLLHFQSRVASIPTLGNLLPTYLLPEIIITDRHIESSTGQFFNKGIWLYFEMIYFAGIIFFTIRFLIQLFGLIRTIRKSIVHLQGELKIIKSPDDKPAFSFFNFIFLPDSPGISQAENNKIILHETIHAKQFHSFDTLLVNIIQIFFWFNPILKSYKNIFVQLHEFEADARAVENTNVDEYCSLLAKVALRSADYKLASHFNNSLTLKRIQMMKTIKKKIRPWKLLVIASMIPVAFLVIACQDQITNEVAEITKSSTMAIDVPPEVQLKYDELQNANPDKKFLLMETDENMMPKVEAMKEKYQALHREQISRIELITPTAKPKESPRTFAIIEYDENMERVASQSKLGENVYTMVENTATPQGGMKVFYEHIGKILKYPKDARQQGIEGKVFVEFIVEVDGSISNVKLKKGIGHGCDEEAMNAVKTAPKWNPGINNGVAVRQQIILPISYKLAKEESATTTKDVTTQPTNAITEVVAVGIAEN
jgi:TonB family protein